MRKLNGAKLKISHLQEVLQNLIFERFSNIRKLVDNFITFFKYLDFISFVNVF